MIPLVAAAVLGLAFHLVPTPDDIPQPGEFQLQGYTVPASCAQADDEDASCARTIVDAPQFTPETATYRPNAQVSFIAPLTGTCAIAQTETVDGKTQLIVSNRAEAVSGKRAFIHAVLAGIDDLAETPWAALVTQRYRIVALCIAPDGEARSASAFYEVATPPDVWRHPT